MPHAVAQLDRLGVAAKGRAFHGISYVDGTRRVSAQFRSGAGRGVRRTALHAALLEAASKAGVSVAQGDVGEVTPGHEFGSLRRHARPLPGRRRWTALADPRVAGSVQSCAGPRRRWGIRRHIQIAPWSDNVEVYWSADAEAYVTPVADDCVGIAVLTSCRGGFDNTSTNSRSSRTGWMGTRTARIAARARCGRRSSSRTAGRVLLVGDAAGYVDALTGEGLGISFGAAELLVDCIVAGRPADYDRQWRSMSRRYRLLTAAILHASAIRPVRSLIVPAASRVPMVFTALVNRLAE